MKHYDVIKSEKLIPPVCGFCDIEGKHRKATHKVTTRFAPGFAVPTTTILACDKHSKIGKVREE